MDSLPTPALASTSTSMLSPWETTQSIRKNDNMLAFSSTINSPLLSDSMNGEDSEHSNINNNNNNSNHNQDKSLLHSKCIGSCNMMITLILF